ncbi:hypothetical protein WJ85_17225 [Burkholderia ubonensis]|uniref:terminase small subunit-like protein n=1 Tax=Burkholderia ubonensis TaxID=101571 RepID=UPI00075E8427|nr:hypothetical protein [Burkholderia ubonensis]KVP11973.1 hypothetical protein WJ85_17225 [Burkholderia ubonensis]
MPRAAAPAKKVPAKRVEFSQALFDRICELIADGKSVREVCRGRGMPDRKTFLNWSKRTPELRQQYDDACIDRQDAIFDDIQYIADTERDSKRAKVRIEAREWTLARMNRKRFGNHVSNEHSGPDGGPIQTQVVRLRMAPVEELPE